MQIPLKPRPLGARKPHRKIDGSVSRPIPKEARSGTFQSHDGVELFYCIEGEGRPLVFCYGLVCSSLHWTYQIDHFRNSHQAIWFDYRGHHNSGMPADLSTMTIPTLAGDLKALFDRIGIEKAVLLGHSMGVSVALEFCRQNPSRVEALVLSNGTSKRPLETLLHNHNVLPAGFDLLLQAYRKSPRLFAAIWKLQKGNALVRNIVKLAGFNPHLAANEDVDRYVSQIEEMDPGILLHVLEAYQRYDASPWLHTLRVPTLILSGDEDKITPPDQQEFLHQLIPGSRLHTIRHGSHCPQMEQPSLVNSRIEDFLRDIHY